MDYDALRKRLERCEISAILDNFDPEPLPDESPLWKTPNLIITPHCSSDDSEVYISRTLDLLFGNMRLYLDGMPLKNRGDPQQEY
jgi:glyoxylate/hydroxypyruvate reductase A